VGISAVHSAELIVSDSDDCRDGKPGRYREGWANWGVRQWPACKANNSTARGQSVETVRRRSVAYRQHAIGQARQTARPIDRQTAGGIVGIPVSGQLT